jgi:hypothetical protein
MNRLPHHPPHSDATAAEQFHMNLLELIAQTNNERDTALECASQLYALCWRLSKTQTDFAAVEKIELRLAPLLSAYFRQQPD